MRAVAGCVAIALLASGCTLASGTTTSHGTVTATPTHGADTHAPAPEGTDRARRRQADASTPAFPAEQVPLVEGPHRVILTERLPPGGGVDTVHWVVLVRPVASAWLSTAEALLREAGFHHTGRMRLDDDGTPQVWMTHDDLTVMISAYRTVSGSVVYSVLRRTPR